MIVRRLFLAFIIVVAEFAVLEAALRIAGGSEASPAFQSLFMRDDVIGHRLTPKAHARYTTVEFSTDLAINAQGVRDDADIGPKPAGERRVLVLGDSLVLSVQVQLAETFCKQLEGRLNAADSSHHWRVINGGVQGYGPVEEYLFYRDVGEAFQPDVVLVVVFVANDAVEANDKESWLDAGGRPPGASPVAPVHRLRRLARTSMVMQYARVRYDQLKARFRGPTTERPVGSYLADPPPYVQHGLEVSRRAFGMLAKRAAELGARTGLVLMPARFQTDDGDYGRLSEIIRQAGGELVRDSATGRFRDAVAPLGLPTLDLLPVLQSQPDRMGLFFQRNIHLTPRGHQVVADSLMQFLQNSGLVAVRQPPN